MRDTRDRRRRRADSHLRRCIAWVKGHCFHLFGEGKRESLCTFFFIIAFVRPHFEQKSLTFFAPLFCVMLVRHPLGWRLSTVGMTFSYLWGAFAVVKSLCSRRQDASGIHSTRPLSPCIHLYIFNPLIRQTTHRHGPHSFPLSNYNFHHLIMAYPPPTHLLLSLFYRFATSCSLYFSCTHL